MPHFNEYKGDGCELMIRFTCQRCGHTDVEPLTEDKIEKESYGWLRNIKKPEGWKELLHGPLLCPKCAKAYKAFMRNEKEEEGRP